MKNHTSIEGIPMKTLVVISLFLLLAFAGCTKTDTARKTADSTAVVKDVYTCTMHPSVTSDKPGSCPVCGMALVKRTAD